MKNFDLENRWQEYLERVGLSEASMPPEQTTELRRAFFGACGIMLVMFRDEISELEEEPAVETMQNLFTQVGNFWLNEQNQQS